MLSVSYFLYCVLTFLALQHQTCGQTCQPGLDIRCVNETAFQSCLNGSVVPDFPAYSCAPLNCYEECENFCAEDLTSCIPVSTPTTTETSTEFTTEETSTTETTTELTSTPMPTTTTETSTELTTDDTRTTEATSTSIQSTTQTNTELTTEEFSTTTTSTPTAKTTTELNTEDTGATELTTITTTQTRPPTAATTPIATPSAPPTEAPFTCESAGEFQDLGNCSNFYLCIPLSSGDFVYIKFSCPDGSQFDSVTKKCSQNATCIRPSCNEFGFYCISTSQVQLCYDSEPPSGDAFTCPANTYCSMDCQYPCWADVPCTVPTTPLLTSTVTFPWTTTESPLTSTTAFLTSTVTLPTTITEYPSTSTTTLPTPTVTSPPTTNESPSTTTSPTSTVPPTTTEYPMTSTTALPSSTITSPPTTNESSSTSTTALPSSTVTLPPTSSEVPLTSTMTSPTSTVTLPQTTTAAPFVCLAAGRFPDPTNCSLYYLCTPKSSGGFYTMHFSCPASSFYNPSTTQCSSSFTCPNTGLVVTSTSRPFTCEASGRFADPADCKSYYLCSPKSSGGFYQMHYQCPPTSAFNQNTRQCSKNSAVNCGAA